MAETIVRRKAKVNNPQGLHARPAYLFAELAGKFDAKIELIKDNNRVDGKSILSILTLGAENGTELEIEAVGRDASQAVEALVELLEQGLPGGEPPQETEQNN